MSELTYENLVALINAERNKPPVWMEMKYTHQHMHWAIRAGVEAERERIIKLLEQHYLETIIQADIRGQIVTQSYSTDLIALIKGENK